MKRLGIIGWRGMVGQVLLKRMEAEKDFDHFETFFYSTSSPNTLGPHQKVLEDAYNINSLKNCDILLVCQGSDYTHEVLPKLKSAGWNGFWVDASSALRMTKSTQLVLDPINDIQIKKALKEGKTIFAGANCTVSLLLLAIDGLLKRDMVEWVSTMTYQAASGAGAKLIEEWFDQISTASDHLKGVCDKSTLDKASSLTQFLKSKDCPKAIASTALLGNLIPYIDSSMPDGESREEWKAMAEASKLLDRPLAIDGTCVRVGALRCHSQALTLKLKQNYHTRH